jgi:hypothetical protein
MKLQTCLHCGVRVVPTTENICPSCRRPIPMSGNSEFVKQETAGQQTETLIRTPENHITNRYPRTMGVIICLVGLLLAKWQIFNPLHAAEQRRNSIWIHAGLIASAIIFPVYGVLLMLFGKRPNEWFVINPQNVGWKNTLILLVISGGCLVVFFSVINSLENQGFVVKFLW